MEVADDLLYASILQTHKAQTPTTTVVKEDQPYMNTPTQQIWNGAASHFGATIKDRLSKGAISDFLGGEGGGAGIVKALFQILLANLTFSKPFWSQMELILRPNVQ